jgi:hypothetical protein
MKKLQQKFSKKKRLVALNYQLLVAYIFICVFDMFQTNVLRNISIVESCIMPALFFVRQWREVSTGPAMCKGVCNFVDFVFSQIFDTALNSNF